jgi:putative oxidoreductase
MRSYEPYLTLAGRILLAIMFVMAGLNKVMNPQATQQYMAAMGITMATGLFYMGAIMVEVGAGLGLLLGYRTRIAAGVLILFMIPATLIFHTDFSDQNQMVHFMKNLAMTGGLLYVLIYGAGQISLDRRSAART